MHYIQIWQNKLFRHICRVGILPGLNWFWPAHWVKLGLDQVKLGFADPGYSTQYSALCLIFFRSINYP